MKRNSTFGQRLRQLMEERGLTYMELGTLLGMNPQTLNRYVLDQREPKAGVTADIALTFDVDPLWLQGYDTPQVSARREPGEGMVPVVGAIRAGYPALAVEDITGYAAADVPCREEHFYLRVSGDSMIHAGIRDGDLVLIHRQTTAENGQIVACLVDGGEATLKRFRLQGDVVLLLPENPDYEPLLIPVKEFEQGTARIIGVAVQLTRKL